MSKILFREVTQLLNGKGVDITPISPCTNSFYRLLLFPSGIPSSSSRLSRVGCPAINLGFLPRQEEKKSRIPNFHGFQLISRSVKCRSRSPDKVSQKCIFSWIPNLLLCHENGLQSVWDTLTKLMQCQTDSFKKGWRTLHEHHGISSELSKWNNTSNDKISHLILSAYSHFVWYESFWIYCGNPDGLGNNIKGDARAQLKRKFAYWWGEKRLEKSCTCCCELNFWQPYF